jgi:hypothetical protein
MNAKIGQDITVTEDFEIQTCIGENKIQVKKGDKGYVDSNGFIHYETGKARGKIQRFKDITVNGYDTENIAKLIYEGLINKFYLKDFLQDYDISKKDFVNEIDYILSEIF